MCGICGVYLFDRTRVVEERHILAMRETLVHRGPDGFGHLIRGHVGLGHRRLSIVDLAGGHQPMTNEDGTVWVILNGEIYNHMDLRKWLEPRGHRFRTRSDTEAILHLYEELGEGGVGRLMGMFAYALYDANRDRLILARDRFGIKPLYYRLGPEGLVFGSEIKAILAYPGVPRELNWRRVPDFFHYGSVYGTDTLFDGIQELLPGHVLVISGQRTEIRQYWDLPGGPALRGDEGDLRAQVKELLRAAVRRHLMSDVPLGVFLSGGIDSSLIVALMSEMSGGSIKTFSIGFREEGYNEFSYSRQVARQFRTDHLEVELDAERFFDALPSLVWHYDEPVSLPASIPLFFLSRETKGKATVILTGEGADELFLGYAQYGVMRRQSRIAETFQALCPPPVRNVMVRLARGLLGPDRMLLQRLLLDPAALAASFIEWIPREIADELCGGGRIDAEPHDRHPDPVLEIFRNAPADRDFLSDVTYLDFKAFLITLLMKQDKMSMAASIESRVPFLDHELVEFCYRLPTRQKLARGTAKKIIKDIAAEYFPPDFIHRKKQGFPVPMIPWLERDATRARFEEVLLDRRTVSRGIFDQKVVERYLKQFKMGITSGSRAAAYFIWSLVNFELWQRVYMDNPSMSVSGSLSRKESPAPAEGWR